MSDRVIVGARPTNCVLVNRLPEEATYLDSMLFRGTQDGECWPVISVAFRCGAMLALLALAGCQQLIFLHITTRPDSMNNVMALTFGVFIVFVLIIGSVWIMTHLNYNIIPMERLMHMPR